MIAVFQLLQQIGGFRPERAASSLVALIMKPYAQWPIEVEIGDAQVGDLLHPCTRVIQEHEEGPISKCKSSLFGQSERASRLRCAPDRELGEAQSAWRESPPLIDGEGANVLRADRRCRYRKPPTPVCIPVAFKTSYPLQERSCS
jgi:hypothetical protein